MLELNEILSLCRVMTVVFNYQNFQSKFHVQDLGNYAESRDPWPNNFNELGQIKFVKNRHIVRNE